MFLWLPDRYRKHPQRNVLPPYRHLHQGWKREGKLVQRHRNYSSSSEESQVGSEMDQCGERFLRRKGCRLCRRGRNLLQRKLCCHLLAEEERLDARTHLLQRTHLQGRRSSHRLCLSSVQAHCQQARQGEGARDRQGRRGH